MGSVEQHTPRANADPAVADPVYFQAVWEVAGDAMVLSDAQGTVFAANPAYLQLYGYAAEEVVGHNFAIIFPPPLREWANAQYQQTFADPTIAPAVQSTIRRKDGTERMVETRYTFITQGGQRTAMLSVIHDITDQKQAQAENNRVEEARRASESQLHSLVNGNIIGILRADADHILEANDIFLRMIGYTREDLRAGHINWRAITPPEWLPLDEQAMQEMLARGATTPFEKELFRKDGQRVRILIDGTLLTRTPLSWMCFVLDLTARTQAEASERQARLQAEGAVLERDRLLSIVAHDLRNPLSAIQGAAQLLARRLSQQESPDREQLGKGVSQIRRSATRLGNIIEEILDFANLQAGAPLSFRNQSTDLVELVTRVVEDSRERSTRHTIAIVTTLPYLVAEWDASRLGRVFANLLDNAIKYSPQGGTITVEIGLDAAETGPDAREATGWAWVRVKDPGIGIPQADLDHIFEWYRRAGNADTVASGTGIGLAGAGQIVEQYGGTITVQSVEGAGSTFTVLLPVRPATTEAPS